MYLRLYARWQLVVVLVAIAALLPLVFSTYYPIGGAVTISSAAHISTYYFPAGGRTLFPEYRLVALYGTPGTPALGVLGEQDIQTDITRAKALAAQYQPLVSEHVLPTFEIISTVASSIPTNNGDYSYPIDLATLKQWAVTARQAGVYMVLDLQPGRASFLSQAQQLADVLQEPNVGLALDPEWRLGPTDLPLERIGSVDIAEVNQTAAWLGTLVDSYKLPQKLFLLHQFRLDMLPGREQLDTTHQELAYAIQMDGQGSQEGKMNTWQTITANPPANVHFGWKNFYTKDTTLRSPEDTMKISPEPWYVSYQ